MISKLANRENVFYWQTNRDITPKDAGKIWVDRHKYSTNEEVIRLTNLLLGDKLISHLYPLD